MRKIVFLFIFSQIVFKASAQTDFNVEKTYKKSVYSNVRFKGNEPIGVWEKKDKDGKIRILDYNFEIPYSKIPCSGNIPDSRITNIFFDNPSIKYEAPQLDSGKSIASFLTENMVYPEIALKREIMGKVTLQFDFTKEGEIKNLVVQQSSYPPFDKEALRVVKLMKFSEPARIDGEAQNFCATLVVKFKLPD